MAGDDDFGVLLAMAHLTFLDELARDLADRGVPLGPSAGAVLRVLEAGPLSLRRLAGELRMTSSGALKIVDPMVADGLLERTADPHDRRVRAVAATDRGRAALAAARRFHAAYEAALVEQLGPSAVQATRHVLRTIAARDPSALPPFFRSDARPRPRRRTAPGGPPR